MALGNLEWKDGREKGMRAGELKESKTENGKIGGRGGIGGGVEWKRGRTCLTGNSR
jgi:hypothetical protein